jgi:bis(5'-nucleosyl)-tetraphosphatase (symmetrical)
MRWVLGDVQGCAREMDDLIRWVRFDAQRDELWCLGDLVNRGPDSLAALRLWRDVGGKSLLGNHDIYALLAHARRRPRKRDTLDALFDAPDADTLLAGLRGLPVLAHLRDDDGVRSAWLVHAGLDPRWTDLDAAAGRHSGRPEECPPPFRPWDRFYEGRTLVVHGHWARRGAYRGKRTMGLDSGCVYGGMLTGWCLEEDRIVQVPARDRGGLVREMAARQLGDGG